MYNSVNTKVMDPYNRYRYLHVLTATLLSVYMHDNYTKYHYYIISLS